MNFDFSIMKIFLDVAHGKLINIIGRHGTLDQYLWMSVMPLMTICVVNQLKNDSYCYELYVIEKSFVKVVELMTFSWLSYIPANFQMPYLTWCEILNFPLNYFTLNISLCMWPLNSFMSVYLILFQALIIKVRTFWKADKNLRNLPHALYIYLVNVQTMRRFFKILCASQIVWTLKSKSIWVGLVMFIWPH